MLSLEQYRRLMEARHSKNENLAFRIIKKHIKLILKKIPFEQMTPFNYKQIVSQNFSNELLFKMYFDMYLQIGIPNGKFMLESLNKVKSFDLSFESIFTGELAKWLGLNVGLRIQTVGETFIETILGVISNSYRQNVTIDVMNREIMKELNLPNFYKWQGMRIARTETTTITNYSTYIAGKTSKYVLEKMWISIPDKRTRTQPVSNYDHRLMDGVVVDYEMPFDVNGNGILYPGDQTTGTAGNIINCRCTLALIPKKDKTGLPIRKIV